MIVKKPQRRGTFLTVYMHTAHLNTMKRGAKQLTRRKNKNIAFCRLIWYDINGDFMFNFFVDIDSKQGNTFLIGGKDFNHIKNVLRLTFGENFLVSCENKSHLCRLVGFEGECAVAEILQEDYQSTELPVNIHLFQGLPKSDKLELIIQKCVELGVSSITPTEMARCVVKLEQKKKDSKAARWQSIAEAAAKQSKRNRIPQIENVSSFKQMLEKAKNLDLLIVPYENKEGMKTTAQTLCKIKSGMNIGILIGPEGGFEESEIAAVIETGGIPVSLGSRILRTETAAVTAVAMCMLYIEMNVG